MSIQIHRNHCAHPFPALSLDQRAIASHTLAFQVGGGPMGIHRVNPWLDVNENRTRSGLCDCFDGCNEGVGHGENEIAWSNADGLQRDTQRVGTAPDAHGVRHFAILGEGLFEFMHCRSANKRRPVHKGSPARFDFLPNFFMHRAEIGKRNLHRDRRFAFGGRARAGIPATTARGGTSLVTTAPAPTIAPSPIVTPGMMTAAVPMAARRRTSVASRAQSTSAFRLPLSVVGAG